MFLCVCMRTRLFLPTFCAAYKPNPGMNPPLAPSSEFASNCFTYPWDKLLLKSAPYEEDPQKHHTKPPYPDRWCQGIPTCAFAPPTPWREGPTIFGLAHPHVLKPETVEWSKAPLTPTIPLCDSPGSLQHQIANLNCSDFRSQWFEIAERQRNCNQNRLWINGKEGRNRNWHRNDSNRCKFRSLAGWMWHRLRFGCLSYNPSKSAKWTLETKMGSQHPSPDEKNAL